MSFINIFRNYSDYLVVMFLERQTRHREQGPPSGRSTLTDYLRGAPILLSPNISFPKRCITLFDFVCKSSHAMTVLARRAITCRWLLLRRGREPDELAFFPPSHPNGTKFNRSCLSPHNHAERCTPSQGKKTLPINYQRI